MSDVLTARQRRIYLQVRMRAAADFGLAPDDQVIVCFREESARTALFDAFPDLPAAPVPRPRYTPRQQARLWAYRVSSLCGLVRWRRCRHDQGVRVQLRLEDSAIQIMSFLHAPFGPRYHL